MRCGLWLACVALVACEQKPVTTVTPTQPPVPALHRGSTVELNPRMLRRFRPLRARLGDDPVPSPAVVALGRTLYFDTALSASGTVSCNTCHPLDRYGTTADAAPVGVSGKRGERNAPSIFHAAGQFAQFWDGRATTVEAQLEGPLLNPSEMGMESTAAVTARLQAIPGYAPLFRAAFPEGNDPVSFAHLAQALGQFERGLVTPSRWDRFLEGDKAALSDQEKEGLKIFANAGCMVCHTGELLGGSMFEKVGVVVLWPNQADRGRQRVTSSDADGMAFKVPSLRNVARTGPYFHDGSAKTLEEAVTLMARHQIGMEFTDDETRSLVAWLNSLTGELPTAYIAAPALPARPAGLFRK